MANTNNTNQNKKQITKQSTNHKNNCNEEKRNNKAQHKTHNQEQRIQTEMTNTNNKIKHKNPKHK